MCSLENTIKISIIVPIYKVPEKYLRNCIESLINQDFEAYEVILIDDGSPDQCGEICDEYKKICNKIHVVHKENEGVSIARNCGLEVARGSYIMFVDGDDAILKNALVDIYNILKNRSADISLFKYFKTGESPVKNETIQINVFSDEQILGMKKGIMTKKEILDGFCIGSPWAKVFRADFIKKNGIRYMPGIAKAQDRVFMMNCLKYECSVQCVDYMYYYYNTENEMSICKKYNDTIYDSLVKTGSAIEEMVDQHEFEDEINEMYMKFFIEIIFLNVLHKDNHKNTSWKTARQVLIWIQDSSFEFQKILQLCEGVRTLCSKSGTWLKLRYGIPMYIQENPSVILQNMIFQGAIEIGAKLVMVLTPAS